MGHFKCNSHRCTTMWQITRPLLLVWMGPNPDGVGDLLCLLVYKWRGTLNAGCVTSHLQLCFLWSEPREETFHLLHFFALSCQIISKLRLGKKGQVTQVASLLCRVCVTYPARLHTFLKIQSFELSVQTCTSCLSLLWFPAMNTLLRNWVWAWVQTFVVVVLLCSAFQAARCWHLSPCYPEFIAFLSPFLGSYFLDWRACPPDFKCLCCYSAKQTKGVFELGDLMYERFRQTLEQSRKFGLLKTVVMFHISPAVISSS